MAWGLFIETATRMYLSRTSFKKFLEELKENIDYVIHIK